MYHPCADSGCLPCFTFEKGNRESNMAWINEYEKELEINQINQQLGIGASLFLMTTKAMMYFFICMSILNLPILLLYVGKSTSASEGDVSNFFQVSSLGHLAMSAFSCTGADLYDDDHFELRCEHGIFVSVLDYGVARDEVGCIAGSQELELKDGCEFDELTGIAYAQELLTEFDKKCKNQKSCEVSLDAFQPFLEGRTRSDCNLGDSKKVVLLAECEATTYVMPVLNVEFSKEQLGIWLICFDLASILGFYVFTVILKFRQEEYVDQFKKKSIEMSDFTICVKNLPPDIDFDGDENILKAMLWRHFQILAAISRYYEQEEEDQRLRFEENFRRKKTTVLDQDRVDSVIEQQAGKIRIYVINHGFTLEMLRKTYESQKEITAVKDWWPQIQEIVKRYKPELVPLKSWQDKIESNDDDKPLKEGGNAQDSDDSDDGKKPKKAKKRTDRIKSLKKCFDYKVHSKFEIADITFGRDSEHMHKTQSLVKLNEVYKKKQRLERVLTDMKKQAKDEHQLEFQDTKEKKTNKSVKEELEMKKLKEDKVKEKKEEKGPILLRSNSWPLEEQRKQEHNRQTFRDKPYYLKKIQMKKKGKLLPDKRRKHIFERMKSEGMPEILEEEVDDDKSDKDDLSSSEEESFGSDYKQMGLMEHIAVAQDGSKQQHLAWAVRAPCRHLDGMIKEKKKEESDEEPDNKDDDFEQEVIKNSKSCMEYCVRKTSDQAEEEIKKFQDDLEEAEAEYEEEEKKVDIEGQTHILQQIQSEGDWEDMLAETKNGKLTVVDCFMEEPSDKIGSSSYQEMLKHYLEVDKRLAFYQFQSENMPKELRRKLLRDVIGKTGGKAPQRYVMCKYGDIIRKFDPELTKDQLEQAIHQVIEPLSEAYKEKERKRLAKLQNLRSMKYAYVSFRDAEDYMRVLKTCQVSWWKLAIIDCCICCCKAEKEKVDTLHFGYEPESDSDEEGEKQKTISLDVDGQAKSKDVLQYEIKALQKARLEKMMGKIQMKALKKKLALQKRWLQVTEACEPDQIMWENLGVSDNERALKSKVVTCVNIFLVLISAIILLMLKVLDKNIQETITQFDYEFICDENRLYENENSLFKLQETGNMDDLHCYCKQESLELGYRDLWNIEFQDGHYYCNDWALGPYKSFGVNTAAEVGVAVINILLAQVFEWVLPDLEAFLTINEKTTSIFQNILRMQFINLIILNLLINMNIEKVIQWEWLDNAKEKHGAKLPVPLTGEYDDFTAAWYFKIGAVIQSQLVVQIFSPHIPKLIDAFKAYLYRWMDRGYAFSWRKFPESDPNDKNFDMVNTKCYFSYEIEALYTGPQIGSSYSYAQIFTMLFAVLTFSSAMPFLYIIAALFYFFYYWVYKGLLLYFYRRTTNFNEDLPLLSMDYMRYGIIWHMSMGLLIMTNTEIIEGSSNFGGDTLQSFSGESEEQQFGDRLIYSDHAVIYLIFVTLYIVGLSLITVLGPFASRFKYLIACCIKEEEYDPESNCIFKELGMMHLRKFYERSKEELKNFLALMEKGQNKDMPMEYLGEYLSHEATDDFQKKLRQRILSIESVIEGHMGVLMRQTQHKNPQLYHKFMSKTPQDKLAALFANERMLKAEKQRGEFKRAERMRMITLTQSYNIADSRLYLQAGQMKRIIERERLLKEAKELKDAQNQ